MQLSIRITQELPNKQTNLKGNLVKPKQKFHFRQFGELQEQNFFKIIVKKSMDHRFLK